MSKKGKYEFEVGDKVRRIIRKVQNANIGDEFIVTKTYSDGCLKIKALNGTKVIGEFYSKYFEPVTQVKDNYEIC
jgi:hypothetical protein